MNSDPLARASLEAPLIESPFSGPPLADLHTGEFRVGPYTLLHELRHAGTASVFLARRADAGETVVLKLLAAPRWDGDLQHLTEYHHPFVARLLDGGVAHDQVGYLVFEYVDGQPLLVYAQERRLAVAERLRLFAGFCDAVAFAHERGVVLQDLKPSKMLVTAEGTPKLLDFGVASLLDPGGPSGLGETAGWKMTLEYASPEQVRGRPPAAASDIFSLGVVLYELVTGQRPFRQQQAHRLAQAILREDPPAPRSIAPQLDAHLEGVVLKALDKDPESRYCSAEEFCRAVGP